MVDDACYLEIIRTMSQILKEQQMLFIHSVNDKMFCIQDVNQYRGRSRVFQ